MMTSLCQVTGRALRGCSHFLQWRVILVAMFAESIGAQTARCLALCTETKDTGNVSITSLDDPPEEVTITGARLSNVHHVFMSNI